MLNSNRSRKNKVKNTPKGKSEEFKGSKPGGKQPGIKSFTETQPKSAISAISTLGSPIPPHTDSSVITINKKKCSPPTPEETPAKHMNTVQTEPKDSSTSTMEVQPTPSPDQSEPEPKLTPELQQLRLLLNEDLDKKLKPLETSIRNLENAHKKLEEKSELIDSIKKENVKL